MFQCGVVKLPVVLQHPRQCRLLPGGWAEQELARPPHRARSLRRCHSSCALMYHCTADAQPNVLAKAARWRDRRSRRCLSCKPILKVYSISWSSTVISVLVGDVRRRAHRMSLHELLPVIGHDSLRCRVPALPGGLGADQGLAPVLHGAGEQRVPVLGAPHHVIPQAGHATRRNLHLRARSGGYTRRLYLTDCPRFPRCPKTAIPPRGV